MQYGDSSHQPPRLVNCRPSATLLVPPRRALTVLLVTPVGGRDKEQTMRTIPVDTGKLRFFTGGPPRPLVTDTGEVRTDREGRPLSQLPVVALSEGGEAETLTVRMPGPLPDLAQLSPVRFDGLVARPWHMGDRSGVSFWARAVAPISVK